ncbi:MAG: transporter [bacterium]|nr:transporter [bacterium]
MGHVSSSFELRLTVVRKAICVLLLVMVATCGWGDALAQAQEPTEDFMKLSLKELLEADIVAINVLGTHTHFAGEWMFAYKFMFMRMNGNRDGTDSVSDEEVLDPGGFNFRVTPTDMNMEMHMGMVMYAPSDDLTLMAMLPYTRLSMDHVTRKGVRFTTKSEGIGDLQVKALYTLYRIGYDRHRFLINSGVSFPTGSIDEKDDTPAGPDKQLPYPMQLGSGTFDLLPGISYLGQTENWAWGIDAMSTIRLGENDRDYTLGNRYHLSAQLDRKLTDWLSSSVKIDGQIWENIDGADPALNPAMVPTADPDRRAGERVDLLFGLTLYVPKGTLKGLRVAVEGGVPIYQSLDGPQLETDWLLTVGAQYIF